MTAVPKKKLEATEYLAIERAAAFRSEFYDGEMFAMAAANPEHNRVKENLIISIGGQIRGSPCQTYSSDQRVKVNMTGLYTYPDIVGVCGTPEYDAQDRDTLINPIVIIEVLSPSTESYDRGAKLRHYQQIATLKEYILVEQDQSLCEQFVRQANDKWLLTTLSGLEAELALESVPARVPLSEIYAGITFTEKPLRQAHSPTTM